MVMEHLEELENHPKEVLGEQDFFQVDDDVDPVKALEHYGRSNLPFQRLAYTQGIAACAVGADSTAIERVLVPLLVDLLQDPIPQIRLVALEQVVAVGKEFESKGEGRVEGLLGCVYTLNGCLLEMISDEDDDEVVPIALEAISQLCALLPQGRRLDAVMDAVKYLQARDDMQVPVIRLLATSCPTLSSQVVRDIVIPWVLEKGECENYGMREAVAQHLPAFLSSLPLPLHKHLLLPLFVKLTKDSVWKVRQACARCLPDLSTMSWELEDWMAIRDRAQALCCDTSQWVKCAALGSLGSVIEGLPPACITHNLLRMFAAMAGSSLVISDVSVALACARHLCQVVQVVGSEGWDVLAPALNHLAASKDPAVLQVVVRCLPVLVNTLGPSVVDQAMQVLQKLLREKLTSVINALVENLVPLLQALPPSCHESLVSVVQLVARTEPQGSTQTALTGSQGSEPRPVLGPWNSGVVSVGLALTSHLPGCPGEEPSRRGTVHVCGNWRVRHHLARHLPQMAACVSRPLVVRYLWPCAVALCVDPVALVRKTMAEELGDLVAALHEQDAGSELAEGESTIREEAPREPGASFVQSTRLHKSTQTEVDEGREMSISQREFEEQQQGGSTNQNLDPSILQGVSLSGGPLSQSSPAAEPYNMDPQPRIGTSSSQAICLNGDCSDQEPHVVCSQSPGADLAGNDISRESDLHHGGIPPETGSNEATGTLGASLSCSEVCQERNSHSSSSCASGPGDQGGGPRASALGHPDTQHSGKDECAAEGGGMSPRVPLVVGATQTHIWGLPDGPSMGARVAPDSGYPGHGASETPNWGDDDLAPYGEALGSTMCESDGKCAVDGAQGLASTREGSPSGTDVCRGDGPNSRSTATAGGCMELVSECDKSEMMECLRCDSGGGGAAAVGGRGTVEVDGDAMKFDSDSGVEISGVVAGGDVDVRGGGVDLGAREREHCVGRIAHDDDGGGEPLRRNGETSQYDVREDVSCGGGPSGHVNMSRQDDAHINDHPVADEDYHPPPLSMINALHPLAVQDLGRRPRVSSEGSAAVSYVMNSTTRQLVPVKEDESTLGPHEFSARETPQNGRGLGSASLVSLEGFSCGTTSSSGSEGVSMDGVSEGCAGDNGDGEVHDPSGVFLLRQLVSDMELLGLQSFSRQRQICALVCVSVLRQRHLVEALVDADGCWPTLEGLLLRLTEDGVPDVRYGLAQSLGSLPDEGEAVDQGQRVLKECVIRLKGLGAPLFKHMGPEEGS